MATQWISKQRTRRQAAPPTWCPLLQRSVPCKTLEVRKIRADGRVGEWIRAPSGEPVRVPVGHQGEMGNFLYGEKGHFALIARDHLGRIAGRRDFEETDDFRWAGPKTTEQRLNEQIGELQAELRESNERCAALREQVHQLEMSARAAKSARFNADMEQKAREALLEVQISQLKHAASRAEVSQKAPPPKNRKGGLPDLDKALDIMGHVIERVDRMADRSGKSKDADRESASVPGDEVPAEPRDEAQQPNAGDG